MEKNNKISIPKPCHEDWNKMTPNENGRFCMSCSKTVVDFTSILPEEIQHFFIQNKNDKICGRFRKSQLDTITIQIPSKVLYTQPNYRKMFLLALFIATGTTLFSCQNKDGQKQKINKVELVKDSDANSPIVVGEPAIDESSTKQAVLPPPPSPKIDQVKFDESIVKTKKNSSNQSSTVKSEKTNNKKNSSVDKPIYVSSEVVSETNAEFPGGIDQFHTFFMKEYKKPENIHYWKLNFTLAFAVEKNGTVSFIECSPAVEEPLEKEIVRVLNLCPKWQPGESNGKKIRMQYSVPILLK
ncbi:hypothetical protein [Flavobacterium foetidum]|uniref:hypothetical protein n=1 Tax=Flavobacterium foetidum TaxID=2026681 RepID=UPI001FC9DEDA|nr:hypothetical protein [Flavobacterium foetidum]